MSESLKKGKPIGVGIRILSAALLCIAFGGLLAQKPVLPSYRSPLVGQPVLHPESLSGLWEAPDGKGGAVGLHLELTTTVPGDAKTLRGISQYWFSLNVGVYQRKGATVQSGEQNYFSDAYQDSGIHFERGRFQLHFVPSRAGVPAVDLDLVQQAGDSWKGRLHRGDFDSQVQLLRPGVGGGFSVDPIVGTWFENSPKSLPSRSCIHIAQQTPTEWTGWSDSLTVPGSVEYAPHLRRPATAAERYGELMKIRRDQGGSVSFELGAFTGVCCSRTFVGALAPDGTALRGAWPTGPNQPALPVSWRKMPGDSCIDPGPVADQKTAPWLSRLAYVTERLE